MVSSIKKNSIIVDSIHGDIRLTNHELKVIDTASFQRLRNIKQLQMSQITYPNATHTRFAHSLGTLAIMRKVLRLNADKNNILKLNEDEEDNLRLAALLHDIGHYPYSHLVERLDKVTLTEDYLPSNTKTPSLANYPDHSDIGELIVTSQRDINEAIGNKDRAKEVADIFTGSNPKLSKLITSSLDFDRMDYLLRDSYATGVPYGRIDINYLLNNLRISSNGILGISEKTLPAAEQFLLARFFMHRVVYYHKTTCGMEELCRQLLRRLRDIGKYGIPANDDDVEKIVTSPELLTFTDAFVDNIVRQAAGYKEKEGNGQVIRCLASSILNRRPPKLLKEIVSWEDADDDAYTSTKTFRKSFRENIKSVADKYDIPLGRFILCQPKPLILEKGEARLGKTQWDGMSDWDKKELDDEERELIQIISDDGKAESLVNLGKRSIISVLKGKSFQMVRLYVAPDEKGNVENLDNLKSDVRSWDKLE